MELKAQNSRLIINPSRGAAMEELTLDGLDVIKPQENYHFESSLLFPFPNRLSEGRFQFAGETFLFEKNDFGLPNALHGLIHDMLFERIDQDEQSLSLELRYAGDEKSFPFPFDFKISYQLQQKSLDIKVEVINSGNSDFPFGFGWHPYFLVGNTAYTALQLEKVDKVEVNDKMLPTGLRSPFLAFQENTVVAGHALDNCFAFEDLKSRNKTLLTLPDKKGTLEIWQDEHFPYVQVFTPGDGQTIAIEPMTCNIDALNNGEGLNTLAAQEAWSAEFGLILKK